VGSNPGHSQVTTLGKLFCHRTFRTGHMTAMLYYWEGNRRTGVTLAMRFGAVKCAYVSATVGRREWKSTTVATSLRLNKLSITKLL